MPKKKSKVKPKARSPFSKTGTPYSDLMKTKTIEDLEKMGLCYQPWHPVAPKMCGFPDCDCWEVINAKAQSKKLLKGGEENV